MVLELVNLYPLTLEVDDNVVVFNDVYEHIKYINTNIIYFSCYDELLKDNVSLQNWERCKKILTEDSALYRRQNEFTSSNLIDITKEVEEEFYEIKTSLPIGQKLFRDTRINEIPTASSEVHMATSLIPGSYLAGHDGDVTLILTIRSANIKCHYYGDNDSGTCEWEVLLQKGLLLTETNRDVIPSKLVHGETILREGTRTIIEYDVTTP